MVSDGPLTSSTPGSFLGGRDDASGLPDTPGTTHLLNKGHVLILWRQDHMSTMHLCKTSSEKVFEKTLELNRHRLYARQVG